MKNESKIIQRMLEPVLPHVDAVSMVDTGSTDNTLALVSDSLRASAKPYQIISDPFRDFGHARTLAFVKAQELCRKLDWDLETTWGLTIDCDMILVVSPLFKTFKFSGEGHTILQRNGSLIYDNTRLFKLSHSWTCVGRTHEYYDGGGNHTVTRIPFEVVHINDCNDGGSRGEKFERDLRLLQMDLDENPKNQRSCFYKAQTLKDIGRFKEAIDSYRRRIELGGWREEVHYSYYQIGRCFEWLKQELEMEFWLNKAFEYYTAKAEPLYHLTRYFREKGHYFKAYHYYLKGRDIPFPKEDLLFIEHEVYHGLFQFEATILDCYVSKRSKQDAMVDLIAYLNKGIPYHVEHVWNNLPYLTEALTSERYRGQYSKFLIGDYGEFRASSCCLIPYSSQDASKRYLLNVRMVNYDNTDTNTSVMRCPQNRVKTKNARLFLNASYEPTEERVVITEDYEHVENQVEGLEDVRLFQYQGRMKFTAWSIATNGKAGIVCGNYHTEIAKIRETFIIAGPLNRSSEKNWIFVDESYLQAPEAKGKMNFIYDWNPFQIGAVDDQTQQLVIHTTYNTPLLFQRCRGSTPLVEYEGQLFCVVHFEKHVTPRTYLHMVLQLNKQTMRLEQYTVPFCFRSNCVEVCLGVHIKNDVLTFFFSEDDAKPGKIQVPMGNLRFGYF